MSIHLIDAKFGSTFFNLLSKTKNEINIISPYIGYTTANALAEVLESTEDIRCNIITRFYRADFLNGASNIEGLDRLFQAGTNIYALQDLHTKLYIFDNKSVILGSANFTFKGFYKNFEFGMFMEDEPIFAKECNDYFTGLLIQMKNTGDGSWELDQARIDEEKRIINKILPNLKQKKNENPITFINEIKWGAKIENEKENNNLDSSTTEKNNDFLEDVLRQETNIVSSNSNTGIWIKFEGNSGDRVPNEDIYLDRKRKHYDDPYRTFFRRRPRGIKDGQTLFMAVISQDHNGNMTPIIVGYAITSGFDDSKEIGSTDYFYKRTHGRYPYYVEITKGRYLKGAIKHGISLIDLVRDLKQDLYPNNKKTESQIFMTHHQKSHIQITEKAKQYLILNLEKLFQRYGVEEINQK
ncbi:hypothetical protein J31TS4_17310 [Paenibacillus sp. J31TS4]|uniref:phospholipase D family protein n=1 Tax=Paenibacillus sp. J31TS4 TaxID=2807195 RepID=UPI001B0BB800|nr:phospholipase D family protein [Paenibacillus sp. J31TS4]GIP38451.1 hypothetical protein J31TS4_17310 [Paenibacillus sp. J31TS4]